MKLTAFDVETRGDRSGYALQPFRARTGEALVTVCAAADGTGEISFPAPTAARLRTWLRAMADDGRTIGGWNVVFDMAWLIAMGLREEVFALNWLDGMLLWRHTTAAPKGMGIEPASFGLKAAVRQFLPAHADYAENVDFEATDAASLAALAEYNRLDARFSHTLTLRFWGQLDRQQKRAALIEAACLPMVAESLVEGIFMDGAAAQVLDTELEGRARMLVAKLALLAERPISPTELASTTQLRNILFKEWRLQPVKVSAKTRAPSTDADTLSLLAVHDKRAGLIDDWREATGDRRKFVTNVLESLTHNGDGRSRPAPRVYGTYTGRMTYSSKIVGNKKANLATCQTGVALHQWKRGETFRRLIRAPDGHQLLEFDFAGQEYRWMAVFAQDPAMIEMCAPGEDAHAYMGARLGGLTYEHMLAQLAAKVPEAKTLRQTGKLANLSCQYRIGWRTLQIKARTQYGMTLADYEARTIHSTYRETYGGVRAYWKAQVERARQTNMAETIAGRRVHVPPSDMWTEDNEWRIGSTAINFPIQGSGADQKYLALAVLRDLLPDYNGRFYYELHDGIFVVVPDAKAEKAAHAIKAALSDLPYEEAWQVRLPVQFPVDAKMGATWGDLVEVQ